MAAVALEAFGNGSLGAADRGVEEVQNLGWFVQPVLGRRPVKPVEPEGACVGQGRVRMTFTTSNNIQNSRVRAGLKDDSVHKQENPRGKVVGEGRRERERGGWRKS